MSQSNRIMKLVKATRRLPQSMRTTIWTRTFSRVVPMVGTAKIKYLNVSPEMLQVQIPNQKGMQNHIKGVHAAAMALLAETATGFITALHVPDDRIMLIKSLHVDYLKIAQGDLTATATLDAGQQQFIRDNEKGELQIPVVVEDETGQSPIECQMIWAWRPKKKSS